MNHRLVEGRVAIVTGAASGIGRASALLFAKHGARVAVVDLDEDGGKATVSAVDDAGGEATGSAIADAGGEAMFIRADVSRSGDVQEAVRRAVERFGRIDVLFSVAGVSGRRWGDGPVAECTEEAWDRVMEINLKSVFLCCKYVVREMLRSGGGSIINLSTGLALVGGDADFATHAYAASKGGIISLTRSIATYYAPQRIRANVICPGLIATKMSRRAQSDERILARMPELQPLTGDLGKPEDVAGAALYLASDLSSFVTGVVLPVDGGWTAK